MSKPSAAQLAGAGIVVAGVVTAIAIGNIKLPATPSQWLSLGTVSVPGNLLSVTVRVSPQAAKQFQIAMPDAGYSYLGVWVCAQSAEAGVTAPSLPDGFEVVDGSEQVVGTCAAGSPRVQLWTEPAQNASAVFGCGCGKGCYFQNQNGRDAGWSVGQIGNFKAGTWKAPDGGANCHPTPCTVTAGYDTFGECAK